MVPDEMPDPLGCRPEGAVGAIADEVEVAGQLASGLDVDVDGVEVAFDEGDEAGESGAVGVGGGSLAVDDFVDGHGFVFVVDGAERGGWATGGLGGGGGSGCAVGVGVGDFDGARGEGIFAEEESPIVDGVTGVCRFHVFGRARDGDVEVEVEAEDGARDEDDEDGEGGVFEIGELDLHRSKLDPPARVLVVWRGFETHVLPVC